MPTLKSPSPVLPATWPQLSYIDSLTKARDIDPPTFHLLDLRLKEGLTRAAASQVIDYLLQLPIKEKPKPTKADLEPGVYVLPDGTIVKVQENKAKTSVYSLAWESFNGTRLTLDGDVVKGSWTYNPLLLDSVKPEYRMTLEQAKKFTLVFGQCARCGRKLKAAESVEQGIGPVCIKSFEF